MRRCFPSFVICTKPKKPHLEAMASQRKVEYSTDIGHVSITCSSAFRGFSLITQIDLSNKAATISSSSSNHHSSNHTDNQGGRFFDFRLSPSLASQRIGLRQFNIYRRGTDTQARKLEFAWDFTKAQFNPSGDVQPVSGYYFCIILEGEMVLLLGDMKDEAYNHVKEKAPLGSPEVAVVAREETVNLRGCIYNTKAFLGEERDFAVSFQRRMEDSMTVWIDRKKVVDVVTKWREFKGSREVVVPGGVIKIMWDCQEWTDRENSAGLTAAQEFAIARLAISYARVGGDGVRNVENSFRLNLFC